jgi:hypothetical protein
VDLAIALNLSEANAGELLTVAQQFTVGAYWYGRRDRDGPARSLARGQPPTALGSVALQYVNLAVDAAPALEVAYHGQRVLLIPSAKGLTAEALPAAAPLAALVLPAELAGPRDRSLIMARLNPGRVVVYGDPGRSGAARTLWPVPCQFTREGAVSLFLTASGITASQWRP